MADEPGIPNLDAALDGLVEKLFDPAKLLRLQTAMRNAQAEGTVTAIAAEAGAISKMQQDPVEARNMLEKFMGGLSAWIMSVAVESAFDVDVSQAEFATLGASGRRDKVAKKLTDKMILSLTGGSTSVEASPEPAARYLNVVLGQAFEAWAIGTTVEIGSCIMPFLEQIQTVGDIGNRIVAALGISDSSSRVLRPYIDNLVVEPLRRYIATTYRPNLRSEAMATRAFIRGTLPADKWREELALNGWSDDRIDDFLADTYKNLTLEETLNLIRHGKLGRAYAVQNLQDQGYGAITAELAITGAELKRLDTILDNALPAVLRAFVNRDIGPAEFRSFLPAAIPDAMERTLYATAAEAQRDLNIRHLSHGEVIDCIELEILPTRYYRDWLEREGYPLEEATALEIRLRTRIDKAHDAEEQRRLVDAERAVEKAARLLAQQQRLEAAEQQRALERRGSLAELRRAAVRGLIPFARVAEVLTAQYDADFVETFLAGVGLDRTEYLDELARRDEALKRAMNRRIDVGALEAAVLLDQLTIGQYRDGLAARAIVAEDIDILVRTLAARKAALDVAAAARREATLAASRRGIDLGRLETLVRRGHRSIADYEALLVTLGYDEAARAGMRELLELLIADDASARQVRDASAATLRAKGLSLEQVRRAVVLGVLTIDDYDRFLLAQGFTAPAAATLIATLRLDVAQAAAARATRTQTDARPDARGVSLATVRRAARLGLVTVAAYQARLEAAGYSADDRAIELDLLLLEIADVQAARRQLPTGAAAAGARPLSLEQVARAVKAGAATIEDYRAAAAAAGHDADATALLAATLAAELETLEAARQRRQAIDGELVARTLSLAQLEEAVKKGFVTLAQFVAQLETWGYGSDDAQLVAALLEASLTAA